MNPKRFVHNTIYSVLPPYIAGPLMWHKTLFRENYQRFYKSGREQVLQRRHFKTAWFVEVRFCWISLRLTTDMRQIYKIWIFCFHSWFLEVVPLFNYKNLDPTNSTNGTNKANYTKCTNYKRTKQTELTKRTERTKRAEQT